jgi:hypothetical protein
LEAPTSAPTSITAPYDDKLELAPGYMLHLVGGHYTGQAALHDQPGQRLFCGDMFKVDQDEDGRSHAISSHKAFRQWAAVPCPRPGRANRPPG